jgi:hypothetical protein
MIRVALILRGESFRFGSQGTRYIGFPESVKEQVEAAESHVRLCHALKGAGFQEVDIYFVTVETEFTKRLYEIYGSFVKDSLILKKHLPAQNDTIRIAVSLVPLQHYDSIILSRIDLIYKEPLIKYVRPMIGKVQFMAPTWYKDCVTPRGAPRMNDMFYIFPRLTFDILERAQEFSAYGHKFLDMIPLHPGEYTCISELFFDSDSEKDKNPYYKIANRPEATIFHSEGKTFPADFPPPK